MSGDNWWGRNWKWFVPVGCLSTLVLFASFLAILLTFVFGMLKDSAPYTRALEIARSNPAVVASLGTPIEEGYFVSGNITENGPSGEAELAIPISGPRGSGTIYVEATKSVGEWTIFKLVAEFHATNERISLLGQPPPSPQ